MQKIKDFFNKTIEYLFPLKHTCNSCGREIFNDQYFCEECEKQIVYNDKIICNHCGRKSFNFEEYCSSCSGRETYYEKARSVYVYAPPISTLIARLKYAKKKYLAKIFAQKMALVYYSNFFNCEGVVFTPMTKDRESARGYNQAKVLAQEFCKITKLDLIDGALIKTKETPRQATISKAKERRENLKGSFKVDGYEKVKGKTLLLIDDVMTTGATVEIICETLLKAGATKVFVLTVASVFKGESK